MPQLSPSVEVVIVDGGSEDETPIVVREYQKNHSAITYVPVDASVGIDDGYDLAVQNSSGEYCWLMTDDDVFEAGSVQHVITEVQKDCDLLVLNIECFTRDLKKDLGQRLYHEKTDLSFERDRFEEFLSRFGGGLSYIGCVVIRRACWFEKSREAYYGTYFVHVGVICTSTIITNIRYLNDPVIKYRSANSSWTPRSFEIWYIKWPALIWSFDELSDETKLRVTSRTPWRRTLTLIKSRAMGEYGVDTFIKFISGKEKIGRQIISGIIARLPVGILSGLLLIFCLIFRRNNQYTIYNLAMSAPRPKFARWMCQVMRVSFP